MAITKISAAMTDLDGAVTINESSADVDFRVESDGNANMLFVDGGNNRVGIGGTPSNNTFEIITTDQTDMSLRAANNQYCQIKFGDPEDDNIGSIGYNNSNNSMIFTTNTATAMTLDSSGQVTMPLQPAFLVKLDGDQNNIAVDGASNTTVEFDSEIFDVGSNFASNQFTAPVTGKYLLTYMLRVHALDDASTSFSVIMETSNRTAANYFDPAGYDSDPDYHTFTYSMVHDMDASDTAKVTVYQAGGSAQADVSQYSYFSGQLIS